MGGILEDQATKLHDLKSLRWPERSVRLITKVLLLKDAFFHPSARFEKSACTVSWKHTEIDRFFVLVRS